MLIASNNKEADKFLHNFEVCASKALQIFDNFLTLVLEESSTPSRLLCRFETSVILHPDVNDIH